jgi:hypothetical protein
VTVLACDLHIRCAVTASGLPVAVAVRSMHKHSATPWLGCFFMIERCGTVPCGHCWPALIATGKTSTAALAHSTPLLGFLSRSTCRCHSMVLNIMPHCMTNDSSSVTTTPRPIPADAVRCHCVPECRPDMLRQCDSLWLAKQSHAGLAHASCIICGQTQLCRRPPGEDS